MKMLAVGDMFDEVAIMDFPPHKRTIPTTRGYAYLQMPYLRFVLGKFSSGEWNGHLWLWGSLRPFEENSLGFAMPLPNMDEYGYLTCRGDMKGRGSHDPAVIVDFFWNSSFYWYSQLPKTIQGTNLGNDIRLPDPHYSHFFIHKLKGREQEFYKSLVVVDGTLRDISWEI